MKILTIDEILMSLENIKKDTTGKTKRKCENLKSDIRQLFDKYYYESFFDKRFQLCNYNKLLTDITNIEKGKFYLMFIHIPKIQKEYYNEENKIVIANGFIKKMKNIAYTEDGMLVRSVYIVSDYVVLIVDKNNIERVYKLIKSIKEKDNNLNAYQMYFHKYAYTSSKTNKNLKHIIKQVNKVFSGKQEIEPEVEED